MGFKSLFKNSWYVRCAQKPVRMESVMIKRVRNIYVI